MPCWIWTMSWAHLVEGKLLRLFSDLQDIARALFPVTWSSSIHPSLPLRPACRKEKRKFEKNTPACKSPSEEVGWLERGSLRLSPANLDRAVASIRGIQRVPSVLSTSFAPERLGTCTWEIAA